MKSKLFVFLFLVYSFFLVYAQTEDLESNDIYDSNECLVKVDYPGEQEDISYTYYSNGDCTLKSVTYANEIDFYDEQGNLIKESINENGLIKNTLYSYDSENRLIKITTPEQTIDYSYDGKGNLVSETISEIANGQKIIIDDQKYEYNFAGELIKITQNGNIIESYSCDKGLCEYFDGVQYYYSRIPETICDNKDDNSNSIIDEGCDNDGDYYVNPEMKCGGSFSAKISNTNDNIVAKVKTDGKGIINLISGWNLVSFPVAKNIPAQNLVDSCKAIAYEYNSNKGYYFTPENIVSGKAYAVYSMKNCNFDINKYGLLESVQVNMYNGWNLAPGFENLERVYQKSEGDFKTWNGNTYESVTSLDSTKGVWVYWDKNKISKLISCLKVDKDDNNAEITI